MGQLPNYRHHGFETISRYRYRITTMWQPSYQKLWHWVMTPLPTPPGMFSSRQLITSLFVSQLLTDLLPKRDSKVPRWACLLCAIGLFIYQSLDAIDGKQARRTNTSSPLGELFDHGCDSLSTVFVSLSVCCAVRLGTHPYWMFFQCLMAVTLFYCAHWQTYVSGTLRFGFIDVTEAQFGVMLIHLVSAIFGCKFWSLKVPVLLVTLKCMPTIIGSFAAAVALFSNFRIILVQRGAGRNGSTVAGTSVLSPVVPLCLVLVPTMLIAWKSPHNVFLNNPSLYLLTFCCVAARITNRLVVAHMTKSEMNYTDTSLIGPAALFLNQYFNSPINENTLLWIVCVYTMYDLFKYCTEVCLEICEHLNIKLFTIVPKISTSTEKNGNHSKYNTRSRSKARAQ
ncbi:unnamed protein product, partial [Meganyctiphanes norvegica]